MSRNPHIQTTTVEMCESHLESSHHMTFGTKKDFVSKHNFLKVWKPNFEFFPKIPHPPPKSAAWIFVVFVKNKSGRLRRRGDSLALGRLKPPGWGTSFAMINGWKARGSKHLKKIQYLLGRWINVCKFLRK